MSVCKSSTKGNGAACTSSGKENASNLFNSSQKENASTRAADSPTARRRFHLSGASPKNVRQYGEPDARAFDLMPPPMPRTPSGKGGNGGGLRSTPVLPLRKHDPNHQGRGDVAVSGGEAGVGPGRSENRASSVKVRMKEDSEEGEGVNRVVTLFFRSPRRLRSCSPIVEYLYSLEMSS